MLIGNYDKGFQDALRNIYRVPKWGNWAYTKGWQEGRRSAQTRESINRLQGKMQEPHIDTRPK